MTPVRLEPAAPRSRVKRSTTKPLRSQWFEVRLFDPEQTVCLKLEIKRFVSKLSICCKCNQQMRISVLCVCVCVCVCVRVCLRACVRAHVCHLSMAHTHARTHMAFMARTIFFYLFIFFFFASKIATSFAWCGSYYCFYFIVSVSCHMHM